jgi:hypothetical protein
MTAVLAVAVACLVGVGGWRFWVMHRDLEGLRSGLTRRTDARVDAHLAGIWEELGRLQADHTRAVEARVQRAETAAGRIANGQSRLDRRLTTVEAWVQLWAGQ